MSDIQRMSKEHMDRKSIDQEYPYAIIYDNKEYRYSHYGINTFYHYGDGYKGIIEVEGDIEDSPTVLYDQEIELDPSEYQIIQI